MTPGSIVILVMGPPGSGKSTFLSKLQKRLGGRPALISSSDVRMEIGALDLMSRTDKEAVTREVVLRVERELANGAPYVFVDMNAFLRFQREAILAAVREKSGKAGLIRFAATNHHSQDAVRRKIERDPVYLKMDADVSTYVGQVADWVDAVSGGEQYEATLLLNVRDQKITGNAYGLGNEFGEAVLDVLTGAAADEGSPSGPFAESTVHQKVVLRSPKFDVVTTRVTVSDGAHEEEERTYARKKDYVGVIARRSDGRILITREFRSASASTAWGIPGGAREEGDQIWDAAAREFAEESGYEATSLVLFYGEPSVSSSIVEMNWLFIAADPVHTGNVAVDGSRISVQWLEPREVMGLLLVGGFQDKVSTSLLRYLAPWLADVLELDIHETDEWA